MEVKKLKKREIAKIAPYLSQKISPEKYFVIGCYEGYEPMGAAVINEEDDNVAEIEWIYVGQNYRGKGAAKCMLQYLTEWASKENIILTIRYENNDVLNHLVTKYNFDYRRSFIYDYELEIANLEKLFSKFSKKNLETGSYKVTSLRSATEKQLNKLMETINDENDANAFALTSLDIASMNPDLSSIMIKNNEIKALMFIRRMNESEGEISLLWSREKRPEIMGLLMYSSYSSILENAKEMTRLQFTALEQSIKDMAEKSLKLQPKRIADIVDAFYF